MNVLHLIKSIVLSKYQRALLPHLKENVLCDDMVDYKGVPLSPHDQLKEDEDEGRSTILAELDKTGEEKAILKFYIN